MKISVLLSMGLILILASCGTPQIATPGPTPEAIRVYTPPSLQPWADKLANCADNDPLVAIYLLPAGGSDASLNQGDIQLELGQPSILKRDEQLFQVGWEQVVVVVNQANPISALSDEQVLRIFSGEETSWESEAGKRIQVWVLPEDEPTRIVFDNSFGLTQVLAPAAKLAPDPIAMMKAISTDEKAIGYLPLSFIDNGNSSSAGDIKIVQLDSTAEEKLKQPVLAFTASEPTGRIRDMLVCLQNSGTH